MLIPPAHGRYAQRGDSIVFATVVCLISESHGGGRYFYARLVEKKRRFPVLQTRLLREVELSLSTAELLSANDIDVATVHCDSNTDPTCRSTEHTRMLVGYIQVNGTTPLFPCLTAVTTLS